MTDNPRDVKRSNVYRRVQSRMMKSGGASYRKRGKTYKKLVNSDT